MRIVLFKLLHLIAQLLMELTAKEAPIRRLFAGFFKVLPILLFSLLFVL